MDKNTLSNYGWIVIAVLVLSVMIALATPFGAFIEQGVRSTTEGLFNTSKNAVNTAFADLGVQMDNQTFEEGYTGGQAGTTPNNPGTPSQPEQPTTPVTGEPYVIKSNNYPDLVTTSIVNITFQSKGTPITSFKIKISDDLKLTTDYALDFTDSISLDTFENSESLIYIDTENVNDFAGKEFIMDSTYNGCLSIAIYTYLSARYNIEVFPMDANGNFVEATITNHS